MGRLVEYICESCGASVEDLFETGEEQPEDLPTPCEKCQGVLKKGKNWGNKKRWYFMDRDGI